MTSALLVLADGVKYGVVPLCTSYAWFGAVCVHDRVTELPAGAIPTGTRAATQERLPEAGPQGDDAACDQRGRVGLASPAGAANHSIASAAIVTDFGLVMVSSLVSENSGNYRTAAPG